MRISNFNRKLLWVATSGLTLALAACGGGGGGRSSSTTAAPTGTMNLAITDGPSDNFIKYG